MVIENILLDGTLVILITCGGFFGVKALRGRNAPEKQTEIVQKYADIVPSVPEQQIIPVSKEPNYNGIIFGSKEEPLIQVIPRTEHISGELVPISEKTRTYLDSLIHPAIEVARTGKALATNTYEIVFQPY